MGRNTKNLQRVVILGGGYAGVYAALKLEKAARKGHIELAMVRQDNFFLFQPMLSEVVSGSIEPPHIVDPIRRLLRHTRFYQAEIEAVDAATSTVVVRYSGRHTHYDSIPYDHLLAAVGASTGLSVVPGCPSTPFP